jgi:hypothetical protein
MPISTSSIIHYTDKIEKIESILIEGFLIKYCEEQLVIENELSSNSAHPMISFCDIPLSHSYKHFDAYGRYGIGLSKTWAHKMRINPVLYLDHRSTVSLNLGKLLEARREKKTTNLTVNQSNQILRIKAFTKNYSGKLKRNKVDRSNYIFYDEREWRLVPEDNELGSAKFSIALSKYKSKKSYYNNLLSGLRFKFNPSEISYIIVDKTIEIPRIINHLRSHYATKCTSQELDILFSKICSTEQIINDY